MLSLVSFLGGFGLTAGWLIRAVIRSDADARLWLRYHLPSWLKG